MLTHAASRRNTLSRLPKPPYVTEYTTEPMEGGDAEMKGGVVMENEFKPTSPRTEVMRREEKRIVSGEKGGEGRTGFKRVLNV